MQRFLDLIESAGNRLPHPTTLFIGATAFIMVLSAIASSFNWQVSKASSAPSLDSTTDTSMITANNLLSSDGIWWLFSHLVENFITFPPLGIVLVGMLGIGIAERSGFIPALLGRLAQRIGRRALTPGVMLLGILSSIGLDAGYVVLPPIAAAIYIAAGRSPLVGIAVAFAGISAGFSANLMITAIDPLLAGFTEAGAKFADPNYQVAVTANWWFMIASTVLLTLVGWLVTRTVVEPRAPTLNDHELVGDTPISASADHQNPDAQNESHALIGALLVLVGCAALVIAIVLVPGAPLAGIGGKFPRWIETTVPIIFILFFAPGVAYGYLSGRFKSERDVADAMGDTFANLGPYIVLAFFAAQFIEAFKYSRLGEMLAVGGGSLLVELGLPTSGLIVGFIFIVMFGNLLIGSASAKYAFFAPVFVPMLMYVGISPELTQAAYRVGDSITNIITPLNPYMVIIVALVQSYLPRAGLGTVVALMLPYTIAFAIAWIILLMAWIAIDVPLGPGGPLHYLP